MAGDPKLSAPKPRDPSEERLLFRVRVVSAVIIVVLIVIIVLGPAFAPAYRTSEIVFASLLGALLILLGVEGITRLPFGGPK